MKKAYAILFSVLFAISLLLGLFAFPKRGSLMELEFDGYGTITIRLDEKNAAMTAAHIRRLVKRGHYDGAEMYGISRGYFVAIGHAENEKKIDHVKGEFEANGYQNDHQIKKGSVYLLRYSDQYDSARSSFGICLSDDYGTTMTGLYAAFGTVVDGLDTIEELSVGRVDENGHPEDGDIFILEARMADAAFFSTTSYVFLVFAFGCGIGSVYLFYLVAKEPKKPAHKKK